MRTHSTPPISAPPTALPECHHESEPNPLGTESARPTARRANGRNPSTRTMANFWLDTLMLLVLVGLLWSATVVRFVFPPLVQADEWRLWGKTVDEWMGIHYALVCLFVFLVVIHLMLHWTWVCGVIAGRWLSRVGGKKTVIDDGTRTLWGVALLILLLHAMGIGLAVALLTIRG